MKVKTYICDICDYKSNDSCEFELAYLEFLNRLTREFDVCLKCYDKPKTVFQKLFSICFKTPAPQTGEK